MDGDRRQQLLRGSLLIVAIGVISLFHYYTATTHVWPHQILQRAYYVPLLLMALWFGWRGGLLAAILSGLSYVPHISMAWGSHPEYSASQYAEIGMFFVIGTLTGILADHERAQRQKVEETARKLAEVYAQLQASFEQLRRADRLSALGELSAGLAHEIRNPLGAVEGAVQILQRPSLPESTRGEFSHLAQTEIDRLKGLVTNFLEFARPQPPRRAPIEPLALLDSVHKLASEMARMAKAQIRVAESNGLPAVLVDAEQIKQVLLNLVINAVQAMPSGGEVVLRAVRHAGSIALDVEDQGVGIPTEDLERIFNPFFTTRAGGTGLGLSIAYQIVSQHGGHISARPNPGGGMTFSVALPIAEARNVEPALQGQP